MSYSVIQKFSFSYKPYPNGSTFSKKEAAV